MKCQIRAKGHLPGRWQDWFPEFDCSIQPDRTLLLCADLPDQPALLGALYRLSYLNMVLLSFQIFPDTQQKQKNGE